MGILGTLLEASCSSQSLRAAQLGSPPADPESCYPRAAAWTLAGGSGVQLRQWHRWLGTWTRTCAPHACTGCSQQRSARLLQPAAAPALCRRVGRREQASRTVSSDYGGSDDPLRGFGAHSRDTLACPALGKALAMNRTGAPGADGSRCWVAGVPGQRPRPRSPPPLTARPASQRALHSPHGQLQNLGVL